MTAVEEPTAHEALDAALEAIRQARLAGAKAAAKKRRAEGDANAAAKAERDALEETARGMEGAQDRADQAHAEQVAALARADQAQAADEAAQRVVRSEQARVHQLRVTNWDEFRADAEASVEQVHAAAMDLTGPLERYFAAWQHSETLWRRLGPATQNQVLERDRAAMVLRDANAVYDDAALPPCPLDAGALTAVLSVMPRPRFLSRANPA